jgi:hypothetical protein
MSIVLLAMMMEDFNSYPTISIDAFVKTTSVLAA